MKPKTNLIPLAISLIVALMSIQYLSLTIHNGNHSLLQKGNWTNYKNMGLQGLMGSDVFMTGRQALAGHQLNLGEWHGHNQVIWERTDKWTELRFSFKAEEKSYLWIFFSQNAGRRSAFRLSRNHDFPSGFFILDKEGKIEDRKIVSLPISSRWNSFRIEIGEGKAKAFLNDAVFFDDAIETGGHRVVSFLSGLHSVSVDDVAIKVDSKEIKDEFAPPFHLNYLLLAVAVYISLLAIFIIGLRAFPVAKRERAFLTAIFQFLFLIFAAGLFYFDAKHLAPRYSSRGFLPFNRVKQSEAETIFELKRRELFRSIAAFCRVEWVSDRETPLSIWNLFADGPPRKHFWEQDVKVFNGDGVIATLKEFSELKNFDSKDLKIVFMGTSQTWGSGARREGSNFVALTTQILAKKLKVSLVTMNLSLSGSISDELMKLYWESLNHWTPHVLVVNLSNNDGGNPAFADNLRQIVQWNETSKIQTLFLLEPNNKEFPFEYIRHSHAIVQQVAAEYGKSVFDLYGHMRSQPVYDSGLLWADVIHFYQQGHNVAAQWVAEKIFPILRRRRR